MKHESISDSVLLSTKLKIPIPRKDYVIRHALFQQLKQGLNRKVIFVRGGAGTGKTTLLTSFIRENALRNIRWLSLDSGNDNVFSFWHYFTATVGDFLGNQREDLLMLLRSNFDAANRNGLLNLLINQLCSDTDYYLVLDDIHELKDPALIQSLEYFIRSMPENFHLILLSRENPALYLGELAVSGRLLVIDGNHLKLTPEEGLHFLKETLRLSESDEVLSQMNDFSEGWIGGLQLVAAASSMSKGNLRTSGSFIAAEYLTREIFHSLTAEERHFLTLTGILSYFDKNLCSQLLPGIDFTGMMNILTAKNLFITCIDEENGVFRYHNILGEHLKQQFLHLPNSQQVELHLKASHALTEKGDYEEALRHLFAAEEFDEAIQLLKGMDESIDTWVFIDQLPLHSLISDVSLALQCLMYNIGLTNIPRVNEICKAIEEQYQGSHILIALQHIYHHIGNKTTEIASSCVMSLEQIRDLDLSPVTQSLLLLENANILANQKQYALSEQYADLGLKINAGANGCVDLYILDSKAQLMDETGRLNKSLDLYRQMEILLQSASFLEAMGINLRMRVVSIFLRRMESKQAKAVLDEALLLDGKSIAVPVGIGFGYECNLAEYEILFGDPALGADITRNLIGNEGSTGILLYDRLLTALSASGILDPAFADRFMDAYSSLDEEAAPLSSQLFYARLLLERSETEQALALVEKVLAFSRRNKNKLRLVEADLLKIRIIASKDAEQGRIADNLLREAIHYAWEDRIMAPFCLDRSLLGPMLREYAKTSLGDLNDREQEFLKDLLDICVSKSPGAKDLLSVRETEVLMELANDLTNPEIAERLGVSLSTVKTHIINIYGKLGVSSRLSAVETARRRGYIPPIPKQ